MHVCVVCTTCHSDPFRVFAPVLIFYFILFYFISGALRSLCAPVCVPHVIYDTITL